MVDGNQDYDWKTPAIVGLEKTIEVRKKVNVYCPDSRDSKSQNKAVKLAEIFEDKNKTAEEKQAIKEHTPGKTESWYKSQERVFRKQRTIKVVNNKFDIKVNDDDVADAIAIGAWAIDKWGKVF